MGRVGCGADCHVREFEGGVRVASRESWCVCVFAGRDMVGACARAAAFDSRQRQAIVSLEGLERSSVQAELW